MIILKEIFNRRSIRVFENKEIDNDILKELIRAGIAAPSAHKKEPRKFFIIKNKEILKEFAKKHPYGKAFETTTCAILVCGDIEKDTNLTFLIQDCAASLENIAILSEHYNLGTVWIGILDNENALEITNEILKLPKNLIPISIMAIGYKAIEKTSNILYKEEMVEWIL